jgi:hypothetical protein
VAAERRRRDQNAELLAPNYHALVPGQIHLARDRIGLASLECPEPTEIHHLAVEELLAAADVAMGDEVDVKAGPWADLEILLQVEDPTACCGVGEDGDPAFAQCTGSERLTWMKVPGATTVLLSRSVTCSIATSLKNQNG